MNLAGISSVPISKSKVFGTTIHPAPAMLWVCNCVKPFCHTSFLSVPMRSKLFGREF